MPCGDGGYSGGGNYTPQLETIDELIKLIRKNYDRLVKEEAEERAQAILSAQRKQALKSNAIFDGQEAKWTGAAEAFAASPTGQWLAGLGIMPVEITIVPQSEPNKGKK